jgi:hypothetical protein
MPTRNKTVSSTSGKVFFFCGEATAPSAFSYNTPSNFHAARKTTRGHASASILHC